MFHLFSALSNLFYDSVPQTPPCLNCSSVLSHVFLHHVHVSHPCLGAERCGWRPAAVPQLCALSGRHVQPHPGSGVQARQHAVSAAVVLSRGTIEVPTDGAVKMLAWVIYTQYDSQRRLTCRSYVRFRVVGDPQFTKQAASCSACARCSNPLAEKQQRQGLQGQVLLFGNGNTFAPVLRIAFCEACRTAGGKH